MEERLCFPTSLLHAHPSCLFPVNCVFVFNCVSLHAWYNAHCRFSMSHQDTGLYCPMYVCQSLPSPHNNTPCVNCQQHIGQQHVCMCACCCAHVHMLLPVCVWCGCMGVFFCLNTRRMNSPCIDYVHAYIARIPVCHPFYITTAFAVFLALLCSLLFPCLAFSPMSVFSKNTCYSNTPAVFFDGRMPLALC